MLSRFLFVFATVAALTQAAVIPRASDSATLGNILSVTGTGSVDVPTTETLVSASIQASTKCDTSKPAHECSGQKAQQQVAQASQEVMDYLKGLDYVSELSTTNVQLQPQYDYSNGQKLTGYQATNSISFKVENEQAGDVLDEIVQKGVTSIDSVSFVASDDDIAAATNEALKKAVKNAQDQADAVLEAVGSTSQGIVGIQVGDAGAPTPVPGPMFSMANSAAAAPAAEATTPIEAATQTVQAQVTLNIKYE